LPTFLDTTRATLKMTRATIGGFLPSHCLVTIGQYSYRHSDCLVVFYNYAGEMGSGGRICIPSFIKIGSGIQKLIRGDTQTHRQHCDLISLLYFFQNKESTLKSLVETFF
jgi:hypothetical protein